MEKYAVDYSKVEELQKLLGCTEQEALEKVASGNADHLIKEAKERTKDA